MIAEVRIQTAIRSGCTFLKNLYVTPPFKVADITENKKEKVLHLMLMCSSPGVLDGDDYRFQIEVSENCSLQLQTQSYQRLFTMKRGAAQQMTVHLQKNAAFCYLPHPTVPHEAADFSATNKIYLSEGCRLIWGEVLTCGRKNNGEVFKFTRYHNRTEIYLLNKLVVKENLLLQPAKTKVQAVGQLEGFTHQASFIYLNGEADSKALITEISAWLTLQSNLVFGISALPVNGFIVRVLGHKGEQLYQCLLHCAEIIRSGFVTTETLAEKPKAYVC